MNARLAVVTGGGQWTVGELAAPGMSIVVNHRVNAEAACREAEARDAPKPSPCKPMCPIWSRAGRC